MRNTSPLEQKKTAKKDDKEGKKDVKVRLLTYTVSQKSETRTILMIMMSIMYSCNYVAMKLNTRYPDDLSY